MDFKQNVLDYWQDINMQLYQRLPQYFNPNATRNSTPRNWHACIRILGAPGM
jgi:hypothetical protein